MHAYGRHGSNERCVVAGRGSGGLRAIVWTACDPGWSVFVGLPLCARATAPLHACKHQSSVAHVLHAGGLSCASSHPRMIAPNLPLARRVNLSGAC